MEGWSRTVKKIVIATKNKGKIAEIKLALKSISVNVLGLDEFDNVPDAIEDGNSFEENAIIKAKFYAEHLKIACLADDSGLEVYSLDNEPGIYSARYAGDKATDHDNNKLLLKKLNGATENNRKACFRCVLAFADIDGTVFTTEGVCEGAILTEERGSGGFGYDPLFWVAQYQKTMAEISAEDKNKISHRGKAVLNMSNKLADYFK